jgi:DNA-binding CsgD family transcriptional regulator
VDRLINLIGIKRMKVKNSRFPLLAILIAQVFLTSVFIFKITADLFAIPLTFVPWSIMEVIEISTSVGMLLGVFTTFLLVSKGQKRIDLVERKVDAASANYNDFLRVQFDEWGFSPTEKSIAIFVTKGFSNIEIAKLRGTTESTVKSQMSTIFRKSGTSSRSQLVTWMLEDVIERLSSDPAHL